MTALPFERDLGIDEDTVERYKNQRAWEFDVIDDGYRYHLTSINAAVGQSDLARLDEFTSRQRACRRYSAGLRDRVISATAGP